MSLQKLRLKKREDRRLRMGHSWIFSNEVDIAITPLKSLMPGEEAIIEAADGEALGIAYVNPHSLISGRLFSRSLDKRLNTAFFSEQLSKALILREHLFLKPFYRLVFSEADGLPGLIIDRFNEDIVVQINTAGMNLHKADIVTAIQTVLPATKSILFKNDSSIRKQEALPIEIEAALGKPPEKILVEENGVTFNAPLWQGQKTGWFYDHRLNRARLAAYVPHLSVLDVFSYVGGWGIQAAAFGAKSVDCIDASPLACEFILENAKLNNVNEKINVINADAFSALKDLLQQGRTYDVVIVDPPAFVKKVKDKKEGIIAYQRINELALRLLKPQGILFSCSCSMHIQMEDLTALLQRAAYRAKCEIQILERGHQGPDHPIHVAIPETDYLKTIIVRKM